MKFVPLTLHVVQFMLQLFTLWYYKSFVPQQLQYELVISRLFPWVNGIGGDNDPTSDSNITIAQRLLMLSELKRPVVYNIFAFLEIFTVVYVWGELYQPALYCNSVRPLSLYYYPILMSQLDLAKFNIYVARKLWVGGKKMSAILSCFDMRLFFANAWVSVALAVMFVTEAALYLTLSSGVGTGPTKR